MLPLLAWGVLLTGCSQHPPGGSPEVVETKPVEQVPVAPMPGGWFEATPDDTARQVLTEAVRQQANASSTELALLAIEKLEQQVVAGMNYRATLKVREKTSERRASAAVFRGLDGQVVLRDWQWQALP